MTQYFYFISCSDLIIRVNRIVDSIERYFPLSSDLANGSNLTDISIGSLGHICSTRREEARKCDWEDDARERKYSSLKEREWCIMRHICHSCGNRRCERYSKPIERGCEHLDDEKDDRCSDPEIERRHSCKLGLRIRHRHRLEFIFVSSRRAFLRPLR